MRQPGDPDLRQRPWRHRPVLGGTLSTAPGGTAKDTWEYTVANLGNGEGCTAATAAACASGFCADGVCCSGACTAPCTACNLAGRIGTCAAHPAGTDPNGECGQGTGVCKSTCDGVGACTFPLGGVSCGACLTCDGAGTCARPDPACSAGGTGGSVPGKGGISGSGGKVPPGSGGSGGVVNGGSSGSATGGSGGASGGSGGTRTGGSGGTRTGGSGGTARDAGATSAKGGAGGSSGGASGTAPDGGSTKNDGAPGPDAGLTAKLKRGGCSCALGEGVEPAPWLPWALLVGAACVVSRARRRGLRGAGQRNG